MARTKEFSDASVVTAARDVFWSRGFAATSLAQLQAATGLSKSSMYETYGSKRGLFDRAAQSYLDGIIGPLLGPLEAPGAGRDELLAYFASLGRLFSTAPRAIASRGCLMLNTAMELDDLDEAAADMVRAYRTRVRTAFLNSVASIQAVDDPGLKADLLTASQIGMMITSRLDPMMAADLAATVAADIRTW
ncbi:TetR/AcrR family transcriptional regulator [Glaciihabitans sp. dw_435]|uniref:TetR/AcrR family transcriptional regulator n=1 Tax=Glaciihabitans sp. dw_435 TaxID=2720081 RepID=UPI001BD5F0E8|nr:TetR/AcrR family transcriptional regulator [Glaciihabitans sp. dw_435]